MAGPILQNSACMSCGLVMFMITGLLRTCKPTVGLVRTEPTRFVWVEGSQWRLRVRQEKTREETRMEKVSEIRTELGGTEQKLAEGLGHSREIGRLLGLVELVGGVTNVE